jgi:TonB family protein
VSAAIRSGLFYPPAACAGWAKGVVVVAFTIGASGALSSFAITSFGDGDLDAAACNPVQSGHFAPPHAARPMSRRASTMFRAGGSSTRLEDARAISYRAALALAELRPRGLPLALSGDGRLARTQSSPAVSVPATKADFS